MNFPIYHDIPGSASEIFDWHVQETASQDIRRVMLLRGCDGLTVAFSFSAHGLIQCGAIDKASCLRFDQVDSCLL